MTTTEVVTHDPNVPPGPRVRLRLLLALLRVLAGRRGWAIITWSGQGFRYELAARRRAPGGDPFAILDDTTALGRAEARQRILDEFGQAP
jgi:hypothetical protein